MSYTYEVTWKVAGHEFSALHDSEADAVFMFASTIELTGLAPVLERSDGKKWCNVLKSWEEFPV